MCAPKTFLCGILVFGLFGLDPTSGRGSKLEFRFRSVNSTYNKQILQHFECLLMERNGRNVIHAEWEFIKKINRYDMSLVISLPRKNKVRGELLNVGVDGCNALKRSYEEKQRYVKILMTGVRYGNSVIPDQCPLENNKRYVVDQFYLHSELFPNLFPEMSVTLNFTFLVRNIAVFRIIALGDFVRK